jgi:hypothetical protein
MRILFKFASRSRNGKFFDCLDNIKENIHDPNYLILATLDTNDDSMPIVQTEARAANYKNLQIEWGLSNNKVHAINRGMCKAGDWDILVNMSDDMVFLSKGFDNVIRSGFVVSKEWEEKKIDLDLCLHYPDGNRNDLITMSIMGKDYYKRFNYIYAPCYKSLFCDNEQTEVARRLNKYKFIDRQIFEHRHPAYGKAAMDEQYIRTEHLGNTYDSYLYFERLKNNFYL